MAEFEFLFGIQNCSVANQDKAISFLHNFSVLQTTRTTSRLLAELKHKYNQQAKVISLADFIIAILCIENNLVLVSKDRTFNSIQELEKMIL